MNILTDLLHQILGDDLQAAAFLIFNIIIIESLLSVDNAAVLATMVTDLPPHQRSRALKYGILGAYVFRGLSLFFANYLIGITWLKLAGGLYLVWLMFSYFRSKATPKTEDDTLNKNENRIYKVTRGWLSPFWSTIVLVEIMDLAFSLDNVFAVVALSKNIYIIWIGVFIGILAMRFVAQGFVKLLEKYPFLEALAFVVIGILGLKLVLSAAMQTLVANKMVAEDNTFARILDSHEVDLYVSIFTTGVFLLPVLTSVLFNFPRRVPHTQPENPGVAK
jgi:YkoY family integral membrane protein